jgi:hypothetical protein
MDDQRYILDGKTLVPVSKDEWADWFGTNPSERRVGRDEVGNLLVSTVFLGLNHRQHWDGKGPPLLFETMVLGRDWIEVWCERTSTWDEAAESHKRGIAEAIRLNGSVP